MIKKILVAIMIALPMCAAAQKFGTVNAQEILPNMPEYTEATNKLQEASKKYEDQLAKLQEEMQKKYTEFKALDEDPNTPQSIKDLHVRELQESNTKIEQFYQTAQQDIQRQEQQLMQPVQEKMLNAIQSVGAEQGLTFIFPSGVAYYQGADVVDVTPLVKTKLGI